MPEYTIRPFRTIDDFVGCVELQEEVWGPGFSERVPVAILMAAQRVGGVSAGAYSEPDGRLLGFVFGITGIERGEPVHWSDMLAVRPDVREGGLGVALKRYQRDRVLETGVRRMRWTFDPLMAKNAWLNLEKLGAVADEYVPEMYGETGSPLHRGIGTDRLVTLWLLDDPAVEAKMGGRPSGASGRAGAGEAGPGGEPVEEGRGAKPKEEEVRGREPTKESREAVSVIPVRREGTHARPGSPLLGLEGERLRLPIPADIQEMKASAPDLARSWREATREAFVHYLEAGYLVGGFLRGEELSHYLLVEEGCSQPREARR